MRNLFARVARIGTAGCRRSPAGRLSVLLLLAIGWFAAVGLSSEALSPARADDAGMMSFLLREGRRQSAQPSVAPLFRFQSPTFVAREKPHRVAARTAKARHLHAAWRKRAPAPHIRMALAQTGLPPMAKAGATTVDGAAGAATAKRIAEKAAAAAARPVNAYLTDSTLRRGDVVATTKGLRVFAGARHFPYREHDFVALSHAQTIGNKGVLAALDRTLRRAPDSGVRSAARTASRRAAPAAYIRVADATTRPDARPGAGAPSPSRILAFAPQQSDTAPAVQALDRIIRKIDLTRPPVAATRRSDGRAGEQLTDIRRRDAR